MKRHEWWRQNYRQNRDLDHLSPEALSERLFDCINNYRTRTDRGKLGLKPIEDGGEKWLVWITEVLEECVLRKYEYPGPITITKFQSALDHAFDPIPNFDKVFTARNLVSCPYLLKFGDPKWLRAALENGTFRIAAASYYESLAHNHARRDTEIERVVTPNPCDSRGREFLESLGIKGQPGSVLSAVKIGARTDYLLFSLCAGYSSRMFGDFGATACLVIYDPTTFLRRLMSWVTERLNGWAIHLTTVSYFDPVRVDPGVIDVRFFKPFRHAYQAEIRLTCTPIVDTPRLDSLTVEIGCIGDCAELVDVSSHPPINAPPDPADAPVTCYGNASKESLVVNQLPDVTKLQGVILNREGRTPEDWFFSIQYLDKEDNWHELKVPMLDGLFLLNMLRQAETEQKLGLWNRE